MSDFNNTVNPEPQLGKVRQPGRKSGSVKSAETDKDKIILDFILSCDECEAEALFPIVKTVPSKDGSIELSDYAVKAVNRYLNHGMSATDMSQEASVRYRVAKAEKLSATVARFIDKRQSVDVCVQLMKLAYTVGKLPKRKTEESDNGQPNQAPSSEEGVAGYAENNLFTDSNNG